MAHYGRTKLSDWQIAAIEVAVKYAIESRIIEAQSGGVLLSKLNGATHITVSYRAE